MWHYVTLRKFGSKQLYMKCWVMDPWHRDYKFTPFSQGKFSISGQMGNSVSQKKSTIFFIYLSPRLQCCIWMFSNPLAPASVKMLSELIRAKVPDLDQTKRFSNVTITQAQNLTSNIPLKWYQSKGLHEIHRSISKLKVAYEGESLYLCSKSVHVIMMKCDI